MHKHANNHCGKSGVKNIKTAFILNFCFTIAEFIGGYFTNSVAIMADALHDLGDSFSLGFAWYFAKTSEKARTYEFSYGFKRFSLLAAFINGMILLFGSFFVLSEAVQRILDPEPSNAPGMVLFAIVGVLVNGWAVLKMKSGKTMNERIVTWHLLEDVLGWVAVLIVGIVLLFWEVLFLDPLLSILITLVILWNVFKNLKKTVNIFLQGVPSDVNIAEVEERILALPEIIAVHDIHVWSLDGDKHILTAHIVVSLGISHDTVVQLKSKVKELMTGIGIEHTTLEMEFDSERCHVNCDDI